MEPKILLDTLESVVARSLVNEEKVAVAYSGGLDSSLVAKLASRTTGVICYTCAARDSADSRDAVRSGTADGFDVRVLPLVESDLPHLVSRTSRVISSADPVKIAYTIPTVVVLERSREELILGGNGADELFGGYAKYAPAHKDTESRMRDDLSKSLDEAEKVKAYALSVRKRAFFPYLSDEVVAAAMTIPLDRKIAGSSRKKILREAGTIAGLAAAERKKKAAQYSSGTLRMMNAVSKRGKSTLSKWVLDVISGQISGKD
jgi:asparagine synthase (glutamine-hydrolysing)